MELHKFANLSPHLGEFSLGNKITRNVLVLFHKFPLLAFMRPSVGNGFGEMERRHWLTDEGKVATK